MTALSDQELMKRLANGDQDAMQTIFLAYFSHIYQTTFRFVKHKEISEDLAQEVFLKLWKKRNKITIQKTIKGYLTIMAYHEAMGHLRKQAPQTAEIDKVMHLSKEDGWEAVNKNELEDKIKEAINRLAPRCKGIFILSRFEGKTYREIGEIMEISVKTVENQMGKALQILRKELSEYIQLLIPLLWGIIIF